MFFQKLKDKLFGKVHTAQTLEELEDILIQADVGPHLSHKMVEAIKKSPGEASLALKQEMMNILQKREQVFSLKALKKGPNVILICGVNGSGKTTFIAKLCYFLKNKKVGIVAGDTFRAAAVEQLEVWADRLKAPIFKGTIGEDPASVIYKALQQSQDLDVLIIDTAGRLQNKDHLMMELQKIVRVIKKIDETAPQETLLVLDATIGSNTLNQIEAFKDVVPLTGLVMNKLDGTAKGGILLKVAEQFSYPFYFMGLGEKKEDLKPFSAEYFVDHIL